MKKWTGLGIVILLVILGSYYGMGVGTEKILKRNIHVLNQSDGVTASLKQYQRGWFRSQAILKWTIALPETSTTQPLHRTVFTQKKNYTFELPLVIYHGPMMWVNSKPYFGLGYAHATGSISPEYQRELSQTYNYNAKNLAYSIDVLVNYLKKTTVQLTVPQYRLSAKKGNDFFEWLGMMTSIVISGDKHRLEGSLSLQGLSWGKDVIKGIMGPVAAHYDMQQGLDNLFYGNAKFKLPSFVVLQNGKPVFRLSDVEADSESDLKNGLFQAAFSSKIGQLVLGDKVYTQNVFDLSFENLDAKILAGMNRKLSELQQTTNDSQRIMWALIPDLPAVLSKGAQINIENFEIHPLNGHIKVNLNLTFPSEKMTNPFQLVQKLKGESHIKLSKTILSQWLQNVMKKALIAQAQKQSLAKEMQVPIAPDVAPVQKPGLPTMTNMTDNEQIADAQLTAKVEAKIQEWTNEGIIIQDGSDYLILLKWLDGKLFVNEHLFNPALLAV